MLKRAISESSILGFLRLRGRDRALTLLLTCYFFLALMAISLVKSLQNGLYLGNLGFDIHLPVLYLGLAVLSGPLVFLYRYLSNRVSLFLIASATLMLLGVGVVLFLIGREHVGSWIYGAFYVLGAIFSVLVPTQGWITAYHLFTPRGAKQTFAILGTGGVLGGLAGGAFTVVAAGYFSSQTLLLHALLLLALLQVLLVAIFLRSRRSKGSARHASTRMMSGGERTQAVRTVLRSRHLTYLAAVVLFTGFASTLIDLHFKWAINAEFSRSELEITQFFGWIQCAIFLFSALIQIGATNQLLRKFGLGLGLMILPVGLGIGAFGMILTSAFWAVVSVKTIDGSLRSSIEQTSLELLYVPLSGSQNISIKSFMELVVLRVGDGLGAALFLVLGAVIFPHSIIVGVVLILVSCGWLLVARQITEEYSQMLRRSLEDVGSQVVRRALRMDEAVAEAALIAALWSNNRNKVFFALQQLQASDFDVSYSELSSQGLGGEMVSIDISDLQPARLGISRWQESVEALVDHDDSEVAALALHLLISSNVPGYRQTLEKRLRSSQIPRQRYITYLSKYSPDPGDILVPKYVFQWCIDANPEQAVDLANLIGAMKNPVYVQILRNWLGNPDRALCRAAIRALGSFRDRLDIERIVPFLAQYWSREVARKALAGYGEEMVTHAFGLLRDSRVDVTIKREIPSILALINTSSARGVLVTCLYTHDALVAYRAVQGLNRIRGLRDLSYSQEAFEPLLQIWAKEYYSLLNIESLMLRERTPEARLLRKVLEERLRWGIEKIFRGLDLILPEGDAYFSYLGYTSSQVELKENAIELIDSRIRGELRHTLLPIFSELNQFDVLQRGREIFKLPSDLVEALSEAFFDGDPWLKCCTIATIKAERMEELRDLVRQGGEDISPMVRETAAWALREWGSTGPAPGA